MPLLALALIAAASLTGCDAVAPDPGLSEDGRQAATADLRYCDPDDIECLPTGGGGGTGGGTTTPQFRLNATIGTHLGGFPWDNKHYFEAVATFERNLGGNWQRYKTKLEIDCYVNDALRDHDDEGYADHLDVEFDQARYSGLIVRCEYYGMNRAFHETRQLVFY